MKYEEKPTRKSFVDLEGKQFGMLTVLGYKGRDDKKQHLWHVQCDCGNDKVIIEAGMRAGATNSSRQLCNKHGTFRFSKATNPSFGGVYYMPLLQKPFLRKYPITIFLVSVSVL